MMDTETTLVILNGELPSQERLDSLFQEAALVICADGSVNSLDITRFCPDIIIGDMDSLDENYLKNTKSLQLIQIDDQETTDSEKALNYCFEKGYKQIKLVGAFGKRLDHTLYNLELLKKFHLPGLQITAVSEFEKAIFIEQRIVLNEKIGTIVSLLPIYGTAYGVYMEGFKYKLKSSTLEFGTYSSISNVVQSIPAKITIESGQLLMIIST